MRIKKLMIVVVFATLISAAFVRVERFSGRRFSSFGLWIGNYGLVGYWHDYPTPGTGGVFVGIVRAEIGSR